MKQKITCLSLVLLYCCCCLISVHAQSGTGSGMQFFKGSWQELLDSATRQQKMVFVDFYTTWCAPCKQMEQAVFPDTAAGNKYNVLFLNYRLDAEKGEGPPIAKQFNITAYPTCLYLNSAGVVIHRTNGSEEVAGFNKQADRALALAGDKSSMGQLELSYKGGNRDPEFVRTYISRQTQLDLDNTTVLDEYFHQLPDSALHQEVTLLFLGRNITSIQSSTLAYIMAHIEQVGPATRSAMRDHLVGLLILRAAPLALRDKRLPEYQQLLQYAHKFGPLEPQQLQYLDRLQLVYAGMVRDTGLLKNVGYRMIEPVKTISADSIQAEDARRYATVMRPFLTGEKDSTKISSFQEEKPYMLHQYSGELASIYYTVANAFCSGLPAGDPALKEALAWAIRAVQLFAPSAEASNLISRLRLKQAPSAP